MKTDINEEKTKPFRLVKYFTFTSLLIIFAGTVLLSLMNTQYARTMKRQESEDYALLLIENLNHQVFLQFALPVALKYGKIQLRNKEQFDHLDKVVRATLHSFQVEMVNIYDMNNIISYSFDTEKIGKKNVGGTAFKRALEGESTTKLHQRGSVVELLLGSPVESQLVTFAPLRAEKPLSRISGPVLGVVEIHQDLSEDNQKIFKFQTKAITTSTCIMGVLFLILIFVVKRGESIIEKRAEEQLLLKEKLSKAEKLSSLGELVAGISHEIRNPLGIIKSSAELLKKRLNDNGKSDPIADIIVEEARRLNDILTDFLNYARPREPNLLPCGVDEVIEKNISYLSSQLKENHCQIKKEYPDRIPSIHADSDMLYQAFLNLLINAMQAMPDGGTATVTISEKNSGVAVAFQDQGSGIPEDVLSKIWDPFYTTKENGTGLGLGIVKNIIESHGGALEVVDNQSRGATIEVWLPKNPEK